MTLTGAIEVLEPHYYVEHDRRYLYVREKANSVPVMLQITYPGLVSDRTVDRLMNNRPLTWKEER